MRRTVPALLGAVALLVAAAWYDADVAPTLRQAQALPFDQRQAEISVPVGLGYITAAAGVLLVALLVRWADSRRVDILYALAGASCAVLGSILWTPAGASYGTPPVEAVTAGGVALCLVGLGDLAIRRHRSGVPTSPPLRGSS